MTPNEDDKYQQQRVAAIRAAASVFADKGFHGATTKDIATQLGIKQGSLYYYFKSKVEALHEVCLLGKSVEVGKGITIIIIFSKTKNHQKHISIITCTHALYTSYT